MKSAIWPIGEKSAWMLWKKQTGFLDNNRGSTSLSFRVFSCEMGKMQTFWKLLLGCKVRMRLLLGFCLFLKGQGRS